MCSKGLSLRNIANISEKNENLKKSNDITFPEKILNAHNLIRYFKINLSTFAIKIKSSHIDDLKKNITEAVRCHFDEANLPSIVNLRFQREEIITI